MTTTETTPKPTALTHSRVILTALSGGVLGLVGAIFVEVRAGGLLLAAFVAAPLIEEMCKPIGLYLALPRWPRR